MCSYGRIFLIYQYQLCLFLRFVNNISVNNRQRENIKKHRHMQKREQPLAVIKHSHSGKRRTLQSIILQKIIIYFFIGFKKIEILG